MPISTDTNTEMPSAHRAEVFPFDEFTAKKKAASPADTAAAVSHDETPAGSASPDPATVKAPAKAKAAKARPRLPGKKAGAKPAVKVKRPAKGVDGAATERKAKRKASHGETVFTAPPQHSSNSRIDEITAEVRSLIEQERSATSATLDLARKIGDKIGLAFEQIGKKNFSKWCREIGVSRAHAYKQKRIAENWTSLQAAINEAKVERKDYHLGIDGALRLLAAYEKRQQVKHRAEGSAEGNEDGAETASAKARPPGKKKRQREALVALKCRAELLEGLLRDNDLDVPEPSAKEQDAIEMAGEAQRDLEAADPTDAAVD